jgi:hypothetical protein
VTSEKDPTVTRSQEEEPTIPPTIDEVLALPTFVRNKSTSKRKTNPYCRILTSDEVIDEKRAKLERQEEEKARKAAKVASRKAKKLQKATEAAAKKERKAAKATEAAARKEAKKGARAKKKVPKHKPKSQKKTPQGNPQVEEGAAAADDDTECIFCAELYSTSGGQWIQCTECKLWAHTECAGVSEQDDMRTL